MCILVGLSLTANQDDMEEANDECTQEALTKKIAVMKKGYQWISKIEDKMEVNQCGVATGAKPVKPCPCPHPHAVGGQRMHASPCTSAAPPPSTSTLATSTTNIEFHVFNLGSPLPNDPQYNYEFESQLPENLDLPPDCKDGEASWPSQCAATMAKDCEANDTATRLTNVKRKVAKLEYVSTSEVEGDGIDDNCSNLDDTICVLGHKNAMAKVFVHHSYKGHAKEDQDTSLQLYVQLISHIY
ncbi:hypothetical protein F5J12DRAFT_785185 [Pisolithus orientalis]|uniref:uncharacterized protein n=1 Tax=Pisolithus orientalis TaxID=936130 RepID=UPI0022251B17|nr:uncharacterized protein F5J12DRAFT_785185 [Pisolithus orientalis]KAI5997240.1 hypothetical protein F5J12DRAFT_785185 [Pisolithus orientalis]